MRGREKGRGRETGRGREGKGVDVRKRGRGSSIEAYPQGEYPKAVLQTYPVLADKLE